MRANRLLCPTTLASAPPPPPSPCSLTGGSPLGGGVGWNATGCALPPPRRAGSRAGRTATATEAESRRRSGTPRCRRDRTRTRTRTRRRRTRARAGTRRPRRPGRTRRWARRGRIRRTRARRRRRRVRRATTRGPAGRAGAGADRHARGRDRRPGPNRRSHCRLVRRRTPRRRSPPRCWPRSSRGTREPSCSRRDDARVVQRLLQLLLIPRVGRDRVLLERRVPERPAAVSARARGHRAPGPAPRGDEGDERRAPRRFRSWWRGKGRNG